MSVDIGSIYVRPRKCVRINHISMAITRHTKHEIIDHVDSTSFEIKKDTHLKLIFRSVCEIHSYITIIEGE